jgi:DUF1707 SHOCT-like domain
MTWAIVALIAFFFISARMGGRRLSRGGDPQYFPPLRRYLQTSMQPPEVEGPSARERASLPGPAKPATTLDSLQDAFAEGRISVEEYERRLDEYYDKHTG